MDIDLEKLVHQDLDKNGFDKLNSDIENLQLDDTNLERKSLIANSDENDLSSKERRASNGIPQQNMNDIVLTNVSTTVNIDHPDITLEWKNLSVKVNYTPSCMDKLRRRKPTHGGKEILKDVSGIAEPRSLLAIMGASGAGKTTFLNVLSRQNMGQLDIKGSILVNGRNISKKIKKISAYVQQEDLFIGTLTVKEHLTFQALLRMGDQYTMKEKKKRVDEVMEELGLMKCRDTIIGIPGRIRGISGGELKRLSFASEIITNPPILFVDEPTSGLDSYMAESVVTALQRIASEGRTILTTIHQPSSEVFQLFDRLLLMSEGRVAYLGPTSGAVEFFNSIEYPCPMNYNPADHYIHTLAIIPGKEEECKAKTKAICDTFLSKSMNGSMKKEEQDAEYEVVDTGTRYKVGLWTQMVLVLWRCWSAVRREPIVAKIRVVQSIVVGIIVGLIYFQQENTSEGAVNINGAMFFLLTTSSFNALSSCLFVFPAELPVFLKDHKQGMYRTGVYFFSKTIAELPWYLFGSFMLGTIAYWMVGLRSDAAHYFILLGILQLIVQCALSYGYLISTISPTVQVASSIGPPLMLPLLLFGGFFIRDKSIPVYFIWLKYLSWFKYANELLQINQWDGYGSIGCGNLKSGCLQDGKAVLEVSGYNADNFYQNLGLIIALLVGFRLLAFLVLLLRVRRTRS